MRKTVIEKKVDELIEIAKEWRALSKDINGWQPTNYSESELKVWCYFANNSDHTAVHFKLGSNNKFEVAFHAPVTVELTTTAFPVLDKYILEAKKLLKVENANFTKLARARKAAEKKARIENLQRELERLTADNPQEE